jgi:hypothetical protein
MKSPVAPIFFATFAALCLSSPGIRAQTPAISLRVEQSNKSEINKSDRYEHTETHSLKAELTNTSSAPAALNVKYYFFGRDVKGHEVVSINQGETKAEAKPTSITTVDIPSATSSYTDEHFNLGAKGKPGKKVDASGARFIGYGVQVFDGEKLVAQSFDPASLKDEVGKAGEAKQPPGPAGAAKK